MVDATTEQQGENAIDDDEEQLVRQVLAENPVEERGVRDEWQQQVGWHRKEDVSSFLRRRGAAAERQKQPDTALRIQEERGRPEHARKKDTPPSPSPEHTARTMQLMVQKGLLWVVVFGAVWLILRLAGFRSCSRKKRRAVRTRIQQLLAAATRLLVTRHSMIGLSTTVVRTLPSTSQRSHFVASTVMIQHAPCTRATLADLDRRSPLYIIGWCGQGSGRQHHLAPWRWLPRSGQRRPVALDQRLNLLTRSTVSPHPDNCCHKTLRFAAPSLDDDHPFSSHRAG